MLREERAEALKEALAVALRVRRAEGLVEEVTVSLPLASSRVGEGEPLPPSSVLPRWWSALRWRRR